jgi:hypothetical protein
MRFVLVFLSMSKLIADGFKLYMFQKHQNFNVLKRRPLSNAQNCSYFVSSQLQVMILG